MKRRNLKLLVIALTVLVWAAIAWADSYEAVTIDNTAGGVALTKTKYLRARYALCRLEGGEIRYTKDGSTAPTTSVGVVMEPLEFIILDNPDQLRNFKGIRTGDTSGTLRCFYMDN
jgi:hypothetical protein